MTATVTENVVEPSASLVATLRESLADAGSETHSGQTWTTSAMYRETVPDALVDLLDPTVTALKRGG